MKIGVDIRVLMDRYYSGVSEYTANLLMAILRQDSTNEYSLFYNSFHNLRDHLDKWSQERVKVINTNWPNKIFNYLLQKIFHYPKLDQILGGTDIFWSPHFNFTCLSKKTKKVITVHDLSFLRYPQFFSWRKNFWHRALGVKKILRTANQIIAVSENTENDLIELIGIAPEKIKIIYSGNNLIKREVNAKEVQSLLIKHNISERFVLYLGTIEPRKNIIGLIQAFNQLKTQAKFQDLKLVLAGARGWKNKSIDKEWKKSVYKNDIIFLGYITQSEKEILYSSAQIFIYPSFYEGFGFPPLEALNYGLPVICSQVSSLPEVVGEAALMINPFKSEEIAQAAELLLTDHNLRQALITKGYERVKLFSWDKTAREYLELFNKL